MALLKPLGRILLLCALGGSTLLPPVAQAQAAGSREYQIKAVFLFNFLQFVEWPADAFPDSTAPIRIGVLGDDPFGPALEETVRGEKVRDRELVLHRSRRIEDLQDCHLLFVSQSERGRLAQVLARSRSRAVLTVSEIEGFAHRGGMINFYLEGNKVRFEINPAAAQRQGLKISSQLLSLGKIVGSTKS